MLVCRQASKSYATERGVVSAVTAIDLDVPAGRFAAIIGRSGSGKSTLMAMIGSFLGWQAVTLVFLLAPVAGLTVGVVVRIVSGKTYLPYGPWLSIAAVVVLFNWGRLWEQTRMIFSDWLSVAALGGIGSVGFVLLLGMVRLFKSIPTRVRPTT